MWTSPTPVVDDDGPTVGDDRPILVGYLRWQRATLLNICAGLTAEQLASKPVASSDLSLLGLVRHLAKVERIWFRERAAREDIEPLYGGAGNPTDFDDLDPSRAPAEIEQLHDEWQAADAAAAALPFDHELTWRAGTWSLRMTYLHVINEYARHNGHADLLREAIDGVTGR